MKLKEKTMQITVKMFLIAAMIGAMCLLGSGCLVVGNHEAGKPDASQGNTLLTTTPPLTR